MLASDEVGDSAFARGYVWSKFARLQWKWVESIDFSSWSPLQIALFYCVLPFDRTTWDHAANALKDKYSEYWDRAWVAPVTAKQDLDYAIEKLLNSGRPYDAIDCIASLIKKKTPLTLRWRLAH